jgi:glutamyl-tRNA reductase
MYQIIVTGLSHKTAPLEIREEFSIQDEAYKEVLSDLNSRESVLESLVLSTCNRTELYVVTNDYEKCINEINDSLLNYHNLNEKIINNHFYSYTNEQAVKHLLRVTSSLDSMVVGEPQILGQVKNSYNLSSKNDSSGIVLNRLFQYAFFVAKKVRSKTSIGSLSVSISYLAVELSKRIFEDLTDRTILLVGTGEMAVLAAKNLINSGIKNLLITSRTYENAAVLSNELNGTAIKLEEIYYRLKDVDIVITATGSNNYIFKSEHVNQALKLRKNEPMFFIDIAVPRDVDPKVNDIPSVYLYDIDDMQGVLDNNISSRKESAREAESIVDNHGDKFINWLEGLKVLPTIVKLRERMESIKRSELERIFGKLDSLDDTQKESINNLADRLIGKMLHEPITNLKRESSSSLGAIYSDTIQKLYNLDKELELIEDMEDDVTDRN